MKKIMKEVLFSLLLTALFSATTRAGNYTATSCNQSDVNAVINGPTHTAVDGDIINIPGGNCTWSANGVNVTVAISIIGAGASSTIINDSIPTGGSPCVAFALNPTTIGALVRLSSITLQRPNGVSTCAAINTQGTCNVSDCTHVRIDKITFNGWGQQVNNSAGIIGLGDMFGVIDHNTVTNTSGGYLQLVEFNHASFQGIGSYGDNSWHQPESYGSANFLFIENNTFVAAGASENEGGAGGYGSVGGGRIVVRFNQFNSMDSLNFSMGWHGTETNGRRRSVRAWEYYGNTFTAAASADSVAGGRGGTGLTWGNTINHPSGVLNNFFTLTTYRTKGTPSSTWGACDGSAPWDGNDGTTYFTGTIASYSGGTVTVSGSPGWTTNQWSPTGAPYSMHDVTQGTGGEIDGNGSNTLSVDSGSGGPGAWTPAAGDSIQILRATWCIDQAGGRGIASTMYNATDPGTPATSANEAVSPTYVWLNTINNGSPNFGVQGVTAFTLRVIRNRDYYVDNINQAAQSNPTTPFDGTTTIGMGHGTLANRPTTCTTGVGYWATDQGSWNRSGNGFGQGQLYLCTATNTWTLYYTPYAYPHPLIGGGPVQPSPPTNLQGTPQ
jgi:hypothetical protein